MKVRKAGGLILALGMLSFPGGAPFLAQSPGDEVLRPRSIEGTGVYYNGLDLLTDGELAEEGGPWNGRKCLFWEDEEAVFLLDLGGIFTVTGLKIQADGNDDYRIEFSLEGERFEPLALFLEEYGGREEGMSSMSNLEGDNSRAELPVPQPVQARFLRISASGGDGKYALGEIQPLGYAENPENEVGADYALLHPSSVEASGEFENPAQSIIDGRIPPEGEGARAQACVYWESPETFFVVDFGGVREVVGLLIQVDGDDTYVLEYSIDGSEFIHLIEIRPEHGEIDEGMDTLGALAGHRESLEDLEFWPVEARFIKLYAESGSGVYSISELQAFTRR